MYIGTRGRPPYDILQSQLDALIDFRIASFCMCLRGLYIVVACCMGYTDIELDGIIKDIGGCDIINGMWNNEELT